MRAILAILTTLASAALDINPEEMSCTLVANQTAWDLTDMKATKTNGTFNYYSKSGITWNMCQYIDPLSAPKGYSNDTDAFAYMTVGKTVYPLTSGILPDADSHLDKNGSIDGVTYTFSSDTKCPFSKKNETFGFQNSVICNKNVTGAGSVVSVKDANTCLPKVTMEHESACPEYSVKGMVKFFRDNVWLSGTILVVFGVIMAMFGRAFFRWTMSAFAGLAGFLVVMYFSSLFGWLGATWAIVLLCIVGVCAGLGCAALMYYFIPIATVFLGVVAGLFMGGLIFSLIVGMSGYDSLWLLITLSLVFGLLSGWLTWSYKLGYLSFATAIVGGYMFMRGLTFYFGRFPSEMEMIQIISSG